MHFTDQGLLLTVACLVGFFGDLFLQTLVHKGFGGPTGWGLKDYFAQHGPIESLFIAGGMMVLFYSIFIFLKLPMNYTYLALFGIALDILFREFMIFPSLKGYYSNLNYVQSTGAEAISMILPLFIYSVLISFKK